MLREFKILLLGENVSAYLSGLKSFERNKTNVCDTARVGGPFQGTVIKAPAGRPCRLLGSVSSLR